MRLILSVLFILFTSNCFAEGLDSNTNLLLHGDLNASTEDTTDGSLEIMDAQGNHVITQVADAALQTTTTKFGSAAVTLDGTGDYLTAPDSADWDVVASNLDDWTIDMWVKYSATTGDDTMIAQAADSSNRWVFRRQGGNETAQFFVTDGGSTVINLIGNVNSLNNTDWNHVALIKVADEYGIYINGTQEGYVQDSSVKNLTGTLYIGQDGNSAQLLDGELDDLRIQNSNVFSAAPVVGETDTITTPTSALTKDANTNLLLHFDTQDVAGDGGSGTYHIPTFNGDAQLDTAATKFGDGSYLFDGTVDNISFPDSADFNVVASNSDDWTIDFWTKHQSGTMSGIYMAHGYSGTYNNSWLIQHSTGNGIRFRVQDAGSEVINTGWAGEITDTNWHHVAFIKVSDEYAIYVDGSQVNYVQDTSIKDTANSLIIGAGSDAGSVAMTGSLDEVRIQEDNYFSAAPNSTPDDTLTTPSVAYSVASTRNRLIQIRTWRPKLASGYGDKKETVYWFTPRG